jgi:diguanylate cyclase (GGDEF)-like protein
MRKNMTLKVPPSFEEEEQRLRAVAGLQLLDRPEEERFKRVTRLVRRHFHAAASSVTLVDRERQFMVSQQGLGTRQTPRSESVCSIVVEQRSPLVISDLSENARTCEFRKLIDGLKMRFYAGVPLWSPEGWALGSLCVLDHLPRRFSKRDLQALADFAAIVEDQLFLQRIDCANQDLMNQVERLRMRAFVDALTGVWNRGALFDLLHREIERAKRSKSSLSLAILDIDHFKSVNDTFGHPAGDEVLKELCARLQKGVRPYDAVGRYGGEEFVVVFPDTTIEQAATLAERLRSAVEAAPFVLGGQEQTLTVSAGVTGLRLKGESGPPEDTLESLLQRADDALYQAKRSGRNRVIRS